MKAITTYYHAPCHIVAKDSDGNKHTFDTFTCASGDPETQHREAARDLRDSMGWTGEIASGEQRPGVWVHVFLRADPRIEGLKAALAPFAALKHEHHDCLPDEHPIFGINGKNITAGDLFRAVDALNL